MKKINAYIYIYMLQWFLGKINPNYQRREMINRAKFYIQHIKKTYLQGSNVTEINWNILLAHTPHIWAFKTVPTWNAYVHHERRKRPLSEHPYSSIFVQFLIFVVRVIIGTSSSILTNESRPHKSPKVDNFWQVSARRKYGRSISRSSRHTMRDRLESEHVFFLDLRASLIQSIFLLLLFFFCTANVYPFFRNLASGHVRLTPFPYSRVDRGGSENFLAGKKSSHSNARWKFGSEFLHQSCGITNKQQTRCTR